MPEQLFRQAQANFKVGKLEEAKALLLQYVAQEEGNALAWLMLSDVVERTDDKIIALENALTVNPHLVRAQNRLAQLRGEQEQAAQDKLERAQTAVKIGLRQEALRLFQEIVHEQPENEVAWWEISLLITAVEDKIVALENVLKVNPRNTQARVRLTQLRQNHSDDLAIAIAYEAQGDLEKAIAAYTFAAGHSPVAADRLIAQKKLEEAKLKAGQQPAKPVSSTLNMLRFMVGPPLIYGLLVFIQNGLSPASLPTTFLWELLAVWFGTVLFIAANQQPERDGETVFSAELLADSRFRMMVTSLGILLIAIPFLYFFLTAFSTFSIMETAVRLFR
ncbi:MAG: hypothetical protein AAF614_24145 [Chloroflexota bacterium]